MSMYIMKYYELQVIKVILYIYEKWHCKIFYALHEVFSSLNRWKRV